jgi:hypothetical protein
MCRVISCVAAWPLVATAVQPARADDWIVCLLRATGDEGSTHAVGCSRSIRTMRPPTSAAATATTISGNTTGRSPTTTKRSGSFRKYTPTYANRGEAYYNKREKSPGSFQIGTTFLEQPLSGPVWCRRWSDALLRRDRHLSLVHCGNRTNKLRPLINHFESIVPDKSARRHISNSKGNGAPACPLPGAKCTMRRRHDDMHRVNSHMKACVAIQIKSAGVSRTDAQFSGRDAVGPYCAGIDDTPGATRLSPCRLICKKQNGRDSWSG